MKFFVPGVPKPEDADFLHTTWARVFNAIGKNRIYSIEMAYPEKHRVYQVGEPVPGRSNVTILALFEVSPGSYVAVGPGFGASVQNDAGPIAVLGQVAAIQYFDMPG